MLHRLSKPPQHWQPRASAGEGAHQPRPLEAAEAERSAWAEEWRVHAETLQAGPQPWLAHEVDLLALNAGSLIEVGRRFK